MTRLGDLYNLSPAEVRQLLVHEELVLMNASVREALYRAESLSMPAQVVEELPPGAEAIGAGAHSMEQAA